MVNAIWAEGDDPQQYGLSFQIAGLPAAQGSKRHVGHGVMVESSKAVKPWRQDVVAAAQYAMDVNDYPPFRDAVAVRIRFYYPRPKSHYRTGQYSDQLKPNAPFYVGKRPDLDKVLRSTFDAFTLAGLIADDSLIVEVEASKCYRATGPGATVVIKRVDR